VLHAVAADCLVVFFGNLQHKEVDEPDLKLQKTIGAFAERYSGTLAPLLRLSVTSATCDFDIMGLYWSRS